MSSFLLVGLCFAFCSLRFRDRSCRDTSCLRFRRSVCCWREQSQNLATTRRWSFFAASLLPGLALAVLFFALFSHDDQILKKAVVYTPAIELGGCCAWRGKHFAGDPISFSAAEFRDRCRSRAGALRDVHGGRCAAVHADLDAIRALSRRSDSSERNPAGRAASRQSKTRHAVWSEFLSAHRFARVERHARRARSTC